MCVWYRRVELMCLSFWTYFFSYQNATNKSSRSEFSYGGTTTSDIIMSVTKTGGDFCDERQSGVEEM